MFSVAAGEVSRLVETNRQRLAEEARNKVFGYQRFDSGILRTEQAFQTASSLWADAETQVKIGRGDLAYQKHYMYMKVALSENLHRLRDPRLGDKPVIVLMNLLMLEAKLKKDIEMMKNQAIRKLVNGRGGLYAKQTENQSIRALITEKEEMNSVPANINVASPSNVDAVGPEFEEIDQKVEEQATDPYEHVGNGVFREKIVSGDGSCAFRSLAQGLNNGNLSVDQENQEAMRLRKIACKLLYNNKTKDLKNIGLTVEELVTIDPEGRYSDFASYVTGMYKSDFAGEIELILLAEELDISIFVYREEKNGYDRIASYGSSKDRFAFLLWRQGRTGEGGNHYNCLLENKVMAKSVVLMSKK